VGKNIIFAIYSENLFILQFGIVNQVYQV